jgi:hypothetical protein
VGFFREIFGLLFRKSLAFFGTFFTTFFGTFLAAILIWPFDLGAFRGLRSFMDFWRHYKFGYFMAFFWASFGRW